MVIKNKKNEFKRKICFVITSKIHYSRSKLLLEELRSQSDVELQIVLGGSAVLDQYGNVEPLLLADGYSVDSKILMSLGGGSLVAMAKTAGLGLVEFPTVLERLDPDIVVVRGDRFEILPLAIAGAYMNKMVAHIEGGDVTGTIDESVRHAVTKMSHIHFTTNDESKKRVIRMGENPDYVFNVGSPEVEFVQKNNFEVSNELINHLGVGDIVDVEKPFIVVMQHPVTTEVEESQKQIEATLGAIHEIGIPTIWFWPNIDAGTDIISKAIRVFRENQKPEHIRFIRYIPSEQFIGLIKKACCLVGNSSAGLKECAYLGTPVVNIGSRQGGRYRSKNIIDVSHDKEEIKSAILTQVNNGRYKPDEYYYKEGTSQKIAEILATIPLYRQKKFID